MKSRRKLVSVFLVNPQLRRTKNLLRPDKYVNAYWINCYFFEVRIRRKGY